MLKYVLLAGAMTVAAPALAQTQAANGGSGSTTATAPAQNGVGRVPLADNSANAAPQSTTPTQAVPAPAQTAPAQTAPAQTTPAQTAPADAQGTATAAQTTDTPAAASNGAATPGQPVNKADQVAQVVTAEFPGYDKDGNGALSATEFGSWMVALRTASDPKAKAEDPAIKTWVTQAFAQADKDKSKSVSKTELQGFLSQAG